MGAQEQREEAEAAGSGAAAAVGGVFTSKAKYTVEDFNIIKVLGKGAFGKVMLVTAKDSGKLCAMPARSDWMIDSQKIDARFHLYCKSGP